MNTRQIEYFLAVADELNFTRAAEKLYVSQTAVTQQIKTLEEQLGVRLFERTKKKVMLTPAGEVFRGESQELLHHIDAITEKVKMTSAGFSGVLSVGFVMGMGNTTLPDKIRMINEHYPNIRLDFRCQEPSALLKSLKNGEHDLVFMPVFDEHYLEGLRYKVYDRYSMVVLLPNRHILAGRESLTRYDLRNENLILCCSEDGRLGEERRMLAPFEAAGIRPNVVAKIEDAESLLFMLSANMGVTILPSYLFDPFLHHGKLRAVPLVPQEDFIDVAAVWTPDDQNPSLAKILPLLN